LVVPCGIDETLEIVGWAPVQGVFRGAVIHPVGMVAARNPDGIQSALLSQIAGQHAIIDRFIHADVEGPAALFCGSDRGGERTAVMYSLIVTAG
jgi:hypothetical protein